MLIKYKFCKYPELWHANGLGFLKEMFGWVFFPFNIADMCPNPFRLLGVTLCSTAELCAEAALFPALPNTQEGRKGQSSREALLPLGPAPQGKTSL